MSAAAYKALLAKSQEIGWPEAYQTDLTKHDRKVVSGEGAPPEFAWAVRPTGTQLFLPAAGVAGQATLSHLAFIAKEMAKGEHHRLFYWSGKALREIEPRRAQELLGAAVSRIDRHNKKVLDFDTARHGRVGLKHYYATRLTDSWTKSLVKSEGCRECHKKTRRVYELQASASLGGEKCCVRMGPYCRECLETFTHQAAIPVHWPEKTEEKERDRE